jgi:hypothetical protein
MQTTYTGVKMATFTSNGLYRSKVSTMCQKQCIGIFTEGIFAFKKYLENIF